jgi:predicted nucleotidyltransferase
MVKGRVDLVSLFFLFVPAVEVLFHIAVPFTLRCIALLEVGLGLLVALGKIKRKHDAFSIARKYAIIRANSHPRADGGIILYMTKLRHEEKVKEVVKRFDPQGLNHYFLFGSSVRKEKFRDIDLGVVGNKTSQKKLSELRDGFYNSPIPYKVDVVDLDEADSDFRDYVLTNEPIVWIR